MRHFDPVMASEDNALRAASLRDEGNGFYKAGNMVQAVKSYSEATTLAPDDAKPLSNLSAASFEMGKYADAVKYAESALRKLPGDEFALRRRCRLRILKAHIHTKRHNLASGTMRQLTKDRHFVKDDEWRILNSVLEQAHDFSESQDVDHIVRYASAYFNVDHDGAFPHFDIPFKGVMPMFSSLIERDELETSLYAHFLKLALPTRCPHREPALVHAPLNTIPMFRMVTRLYELEYPAHWLSTVLHNLAHGTIITSARAPPAYPVTRKDSCVMEQNRKRKISIKPFAAEFSTLTTLFTSCLPFGVISPAIPCISNVHRYSISFPPFATTEELDTALMLVFFNTTLPSFSRPVDLRHALLDDDKGDCSPDAKRLRDEGVAVVKTFIWNMLERSAEFWMRKDEVERWCNEEWEVSVWRADDWSRVNSGVKVNEGLVEMDGLFPNEQADLEI
ncbi:uncharacterized protein BDZ99DRAFT_499050 [Mytilinidion resinicola]|uniref:TPR-like protein n=1 Tax=Mytilinidion resinicola TaxID=574789 RepID=A0A6A6YLK4_9PEZI|nr:uncharacterized protein BDZ99DRAFT_499050 [Mytilinidion resinicola]KAF2809756.1 hypothetical protein BDZ99DRAFT_499050 [Mytilinidion resinicola]